MKKIDIGWSVIFAKLSEIDHPGRKVYGIPKGGMIAAGFLKHATNVSTPEEADLILDDVLETGRTMDRYKKKYPDKEWYVLINKNIEWHPEEKPWIVFPWERQHPMAGDASISDSVLRLIQYIGEDTSRPGLIDTPDRVIKSYKTLFGGYNVDVANLFKTFDGEAYDDIVLLKNIEMFSTCEHHMLPFYGKAHVAYMPDPKNKKVVGISKLARVLEAYSRRLQIQERIGAQVVEALMRYLEPLGAACIIESKHMCMTCRGVNKQESVMVTSSLSGKLKESAVKKELMSLIQL